MRRFIERLKHSITKDFNNLGSEDSVSNQSILIKWVIIGVLAFLTVLFALLQVSFSSNYEAETEIESEIPSLDTNSNSEVEQGATPEEEVVDDGPMFGFQEEELPELSENEELVLKEQIWQAVLVEDYEKAADLAYNAVHTQSIREDSDFLGWYQDIYTLANVTNIETSQQATILSSFKTPRFQAVFPPYTSVLTLATIVEDDDSLLPIDIKSTQVLSEELVNPADCEGISPYVDNMLIHFKEVYKATLYLNSEVTVIALVGIFNNGHNQLLGYYGEDTPYKTDSYWESKRLDYADHPFF